MEWFTPYHVIAGVRIIPAEKRKRASQRESSISLVPRHSNKYYKEIQEENGLIWDSFRRWMTQGLGKQIQVHPLMCKKLRRPDLPTVIWEVLKRYEDVFPSEFPKGVPPARMGHEQRWANNLQLSWSTSAMRFRRTTLRCGQEPTRHVVLWTAKVAKCGRRGKNVDGIGKACQCHGIVICGHYRRDLLFVDKKW